MGSRMDNLDLLSDEELRLRLMQYGFQNMPVTSTTRKLLIKKLRNHMESEKGKLRRETSYVTRYSSGEESDGERRQKRRSATSAGNTRTTMPPPATRPISKRISSNNSAISQSSSLLNHNNNNNNNNNNNHNKSLSPGTGKSSVYISPVIINDSEEEDYTSGLRTTSRIFGNASSSPSALFRRATSSNTYSTPTRSPVSLTATTPSYTSTYNRASSAINNNSPTAATTVGVTGASLSDSTNSNGSASESPFVSEYTKRLLQLRGETVTHENYNSAIGNALSSIGGGGVAAGGGSGLNLNHSTAPISGNHFRNRYSYSSRYSGNHSDRTNSGIHNGSSNSFNENDIVTHAQPTPEPPHIPLRVALRNLITKLDEHYGFKQTFIPCALLCLFVAFLVFVAFMYMTISTDIVSTLNSIDTRYDLCEHAAPDVSRCVTQADVGPALELLKLVGTELKDRVVKSKCVDSSVSYIMSADEVLKLAKERSPNLLIPQLIRHMHTMEYLIDQNPQWRINHCDQHGAEIGFDEVLRRRPAKSNHFGILRPKLPFTCMLYNKFHTFFVIVGVLGLFGIVTYLIHYFFKFVLYVKQKRKDQVNALINEIVQAVSQAAASANGNDSSDIIVNHLRDRLIAPDSRKKLEWAWFEALQFLEQNDSRIQFKVGNRGGEDYKMMCWADSAPPPAISSARSVPGGAKKWQSPAFDNTNKIPDPPTPCLKIRQMFDKYEVNDPNLKTIVQDAILEKVGSRCKIYDIQLDRNTCCVYVRCATAKDAGIVHDEINGWWFDNRLVSIKFLRLERYLARFPRSSVGPNCLKPSNHNNSSMSQQQQQQQSRDRPSSPLERDDDEEDDEEEDDVELE
ncbi:inner nuclear membrane protein Man1 [Toxorhynchites rutilus septentrionalis]|uniref:inner nuclear membrane protein Man1 n=1 Tax=Toxorhynchites rutilus septentrionalis TaxID=329112 RepID=UPI002478D758|nr:inner nuclear membrane protein Man1 [Toxorhynchites rutilus septentrionalis]XP_055625023.1 inner nuclear membrane protein Man1 [Toxorhynchites rutilus septentrionalis]